ncbi:MAG: hypothetical protein IJI14_01445 [Anaerolineaceae bacterium]|nr:hypothetical protein [Anaerolineaceae bacterium]
MRIMEDQQAEKEADQLSTGVNAVTPDALREEMNAMQEPGQPNIPSIPELQLPEAELLLNEENAPDLVVEAPKKKKLKKKKKK